MTGKKGLAMTGKEELAVTRRRKVAMTEREEFAMTGKIKVATTEVATVKTSVARHNTPPKDRHISSLLINIRKFDRLRLFSLYTTMRASERALKYIMIKYSLCKTKLKRIFKKVSLSLKKFFGN